MSDFFVPMHLATMSSSATAANLRQVIRGKVLDHDVRGHGHPFKVEEFNVYQPGLGEAPRCQEWLEG